MKPPIFAITLCMALAGTNVPTHASDLSRGVDAYRAAHEAAIVGELDALVRIPSVAANPQGILKAAHRLQDALIARGFRTAQFATTAGSPPVVFGDYRAPGATRTVIFYAHYDGQPVTPAQWSSGPFDPVMRNGPLTPAARLIDWRRTTTSLDSEWRLFGRAAADDKASIVAFLAAFDALRALHRAPSVNLKVLWEGEEEAGSPHLAEILKNNAPQLRSDLLLIGDGPVHQSGMPTLYFGARGVADLEMTVYGPLHPLHDGHYGNWAPNPAVMAAELIASLRNSNARILIPGFYDDVRPPGAAEKQAIANLPAVERALGREFGVGRSESRDTLAASIMRPALNVRGLFSGSVGAQANNAIPAEAQISIDFRLVPDETPQSVRTKVEAFLKDKSWTIVSVTPDLAARLDHPKIVRLVWGDGYPAFETDMTTPQARAVIRAIEGASGGRVALVPMMGGSVPMYLFHDALQAPVIVLPIVNYDDSQHAPNENLRLGNLWDGIDTYAAMMAELAW